MDRVIENPISGERIVVRQSGANNAGRLLAFDLYLPPGGHVPAKHAHPQQSETFTVITGRMRFRIGRQTIRVGPGERVLVPAGRPHWFGNDGEGVAHAEVEVMPALRMEEFFERTEAISRAGRFPGTRMPRLADTAQMLIEFRNEVSIPGIPSLAARAVLSPLAWFAGWRTRRIGRRRRPG